MAEDLPDEGIAFETLAELFWTYVGLMLNIFRLHARLIFIIIDVFLPIIVTIWYGNHTNDVVLYPRGALWRETKYVLMTYLLWPGFVFASTGPWFWLHKIFWLVIVPIIIVLWSIDSWFNWWTNSNVKLTVRMPGHSITRYQFSASEIENNRIPAAPVLPPGFIGPAQAPIVPNPLIPAAPLFKNAVDVRSQIRSLRKITTTTLDMYHVNVANTEMYLCTELLTCCVLHFSRASPSKEAISSFLMTQTQFNLTDAEWVRHTQFAPCVIQYELRQLKNESVGIETIAEELTNYDELSNKDKMRKFRLFLHGLMGSKTGLQKTTVVVSYLIAIFFFVMIFATMSKLYNAVDRFFVYADTSIMRQSAVIRDMLFEEQGAMLVKPALKQMKRDFKWMQKPTNESGKFSKLISVLPKEYMPLCLGYHYDRSSAENMVRAIEQRVAVTNVTKNYRLDRPLANREATTLSNQLRPLCEEEFAYPDRERVVSWLESRHYPIARKTQILKAYDEAESLMPEDILKQRSGRVEAFIKEEFYPEYKNPRAILARGDLAKAILGPMFDQLNRVFFTLPETVKKIPANLRPAYIESRCKGPYYYVTDHTAFECSATADIQRNMEMVVYRDIMGEDAMPYLDILLQTQVIKTGNGAAKSPASRFSGEMNTSLGNSITNYIFIKMLLANQGLSEDANFFIEGDDGLICCTKPLDVSRAALYATTQGFNLKIQQANSPGEAGFLSTFWEADQTVFKYPLGKYMAGHAWRVPGRPISDEDLLLARLSSTIEENPKNNLVIALHDALCVKYNKTVGESYAYKPNDNYFREKLDMQKVEYVEENGMLKYLLPRFELHPLGAEFLNDYYQINAGYYAELMAKINADPVKAYREVTEVLSLHMDTCSVYDYNLNSSLSF